jgi:hypothetical protein
MSLTQSEYGMRNKIKAKNFKSKRGRTQEK